MSVQVFMLALVFLGTLNKQLQVCQYNASGDILPGQSGCYNLQPVFKWIKRCIISIFIVFWIAFVPLFVQGGWSELSLCSTDASQSSQNVVLAARSCDCAGTSCPCHPFSRSFPRRSTCTLYSTT